nr:FtsX-like permease family protein [Flavobacterium sp.]
IAPRLLESSMHWGNFNFGLLLKIPNPQDVASVKEDIEKVYYEQRTIPRAAEEGFSPEEYEQKYGRTGVILESLESSRLHSVVHGYPEGQGNYQYLLIMVGVSVLILILSVVNYVNLATANAIKRAKEVGVRKILGARRSNIVWQFLFETVLLTVFAILLALAIVELALPYYNEFLGKELLIHGSEFYLQLLIIFVVVMIAAGILPSLYVSGFESLKVLKGNFGRSKSGVWLRNGMLVLQFAIAAFFICGSYIVYQQVQYMTTKDLGFNGEQVLQIGYKKRFDPREENVDQKMLGRYMTIRDELSKIPGVQQVGAGAFAFGTGAGSSSGFEYNANHVQGQNMGVDFGLLEMFDIKISEGRKLDSKFASDTISSVLINETAAKLMAEKDPIGKKIQWNDKELTIVGVVSDFHFGGLQREIPPMVFFHFKTVKWMIFNVNNMYVKVDPARLDETLPQIEKLWTSDVNMYYPFKYDFVDKDFARTYETYVKQKDLFSLLNVVVIIIALFGLFALASYSIQRRMKEIAIRKTMGAETPTLLRQLSKQYLIFCVIGFAIALFPTIYIFGKWLENFAFRIEIKALPFVIGFVVLSTLTLIIVLAKAYQATRVDILKYLKYE